MLDHFYNAGADAACLRLKVAFELPSMGSLLPKAKAFGMGQMAAGKDLLANLRGGLGGKMNPGVITGPVPAQSMDLARASMRQQALGNMRTLAPSLGVAGGAYLLHRHNQNVEQQQRMRQQMLAPQMGGGGYPGM